jgi:tRNA pseudouridine55 synthase
VGARPRAARAARPRVAGDGMLLVDKPDGPTSRAVVDDLVRRFGRRDIGHAGTLDPFATGLLLVLVGRATRLVPWIQEWPKRYRALVRFGTATDTLDRTGAVTARSEVPTDLGRRLPAAVAALTGGILQAPPMVSAARVGGRRLHDIARAGEVVEREARERIVHAFDIVAWQPPDLLCDVTCSSGTYVRVLAESLGGLVGVPAHLAELRRTAIGPWPVDDADAPADDRPMIPLANVLLDWPVHAATEAEAADIAHGRIPATWSPSVPEAARCRVVKDGRLLALVERRDAGIRFLRVFPPTASGEAA